MIRFVAVLLYPELGYQCQVEGFSGRTYGMTSFDAPNGCYAFRMPIEEWNKNFKDIQAQLVHSHRPLVKFEQEEVAEASPAPEAPKAAEATPIEAVPPQGDPTTLIDRAKAAVLASSKTMRPAQLAEELGVETEALRQVIELDGSGLQIKGGWIHAAAA